MEPYAFAMSVSVSREVLIGTSDDSSDDAVGVEDPVGGMEQLATTRAMSLQ